MTRRLARWGAALTIALSLASTANVAGAEPATLRCDPQTTLAAVARRMGIALRAEVPLPVIRFESATPTRYFGNAVEGQWGFRPERFSNAYVHATNEIFLIDDPSYYRRFGRTIDDSLAHELTHYLQAHYARADLAGEYQEAEAVTVQHWFRTEHVRTRVAQMGR